MARPSATSSASAISTETAGRRAARTSSCANIAPRVDSASWTARASSRSSGRTVVAASAAQASRSWRRTRLIGVRRGTARPAPHRRPHVTSPDRVS